MWFHGFSRAYFVGIVDSSMIDIQICDTWVLNCAVVGWYHICYCVPSNNSNTQKILQEKRTGGPQPLVWPCGLPSKKETQDGWFVGCATKASEHQEGDSRKRSKVNPRSACPCPHVPFVKSTAWHLNKKRTLESMSQKVFQFQCAFFTSKKHQCFIKFDSYQSNLPPGNLT